jgi:hypothetical protein
MIGIRRNDGLIVASADQRASTPKRRENHSGWHIVTPKEHVDSEVM